MVHRSYTELSQLQTLQDRFSYLRLDGRIGEPTFGSERWVNQRFYRSSEWRQIRSFVIARDLGYDLGSDDFQIRGDPIIHHMNPMTLEDIQNGSDSILDPEFLISTSLRTHNAIHYGDEDLLPRPFVERYPGDTRLR